MAANSPNPRRDPECRSKWGECQFKELGYPDLVATTWFSMSGPKSLPADIVQKVNAAVDKAKDSPEVQKRLAIEAMETEKMNPEEFTKFVADELAKWGPVAKATFKP